MKSEKIQKYINNCYHNNSTTYSKYEVEDIVVMAEQEMEERHKKEMQELRDKATKLVKDLFEKLQESEDCEIEIYSNFINYINNFAQELNEDE